MAAAEAHRITVFCDGSYHARRATGDGAATVGVWSSLATFAAAVRAGSAFGAELQAVFAALVMVSMWSDPVLVLTDCQSIPGWLKRTQAPRAFGSVWLEVNALLAAADRLVEWRPRTDPGIRRAHALAAAVRTGSGPTRDRRRPAQPPRNDVTPYKD